jgi:hypothetical protein
MKSLVLAAGLLAAAAGATARAADLDEGPPPDRYGAYEDPRYNDMYSHPRPPAYAPPPSAQYGGPPPGVPYGGPPGPQPGLAYGEPPPGPGYGRPQPAYAPPSPQYGQYGPQYGDGGPPRPPGYVYRDDYRDEDGGYRGGGGYAQPYAGGCAPPEEIKERLLHQGWRDFRDADERGAFVTIIAHRPNGRPFALTLDRCSGSIVGARPLDEGHFAYGPPPQRWPY